MYSAVSFFTAGGSKMEDWNEVVQLLDSSNFDWLSIESPQTIHRWVKRHFDIIYGSRNHNYPQENDQLELLIPESDC